MSKPKLFSPGPINVTASTYEAMSAPMIGHRGKDFEELYADIQPKLQEVTKTTQPVYISTSSAWGVMEASIRNLVQKKVLNLCCGAFSDKWFDVAQRCGKDADKIQVEWGQPIDPEVVRAKLAEGGFDTVTLVHNETSTGVMNPLEEIINVVKSFDDILIVVDTVSSFTAVPIEVEKLGIDCMLAGVQKAVALPPGITIFTLSPAAIERTKTSTDRGYYFDFMEFVKNGEKNNTPSTPPITLIYGLQHKLNEMLAEGLDNRYARHEKLNQMVINWATKYGFEIFSPEGYRSKTLVTVANNLDIDVSLLVKTLREKHNFLINGGYGKVKGSTFRISNMGDETVETMTELLDALDDVMPSIIAK